MFSRSKWCTEYQLGERFFQRFKSKVPLIARDDLAFPRLQVDNGAKTVVLQLENVIGMVEGLPHQAEPHGVNAWQHNSSLHSARACCSEHALAFSTAATFAGLGLFESFIPDLILQ